MRQIDEGQNPRRADGPRKRQVHQHVSILCLLDPVAVTPPGCPRPTWSRGTGRRRKGARAKRSGHLARVVGAGACRFTRRERAESKGALPDGGTRVRSTSCAGGSWVLGPRCRRAGFATRARRLISPVVTAKGSSPTDTACVIPDPGTCEEQALEGANAQESTGPTSSPWPGPGVVGERTPGGSKAAKWACRPFSGEPSLNRTERAQGGLSRARFRLEPVVAGIRCHGSVVPIGLRAGRGQRARRDGESGHGLPIKLRRRWSVTNLQGSTRPARAGTASREGKALKGSSRDASGMEQGREASGRHGERRASQGYVRAANAAQSVVRGKNPEDGTGEGLATFVRHGGSHRCGVKGHPA